MTLQSYGALTFVPLPFSVQLVECTIAARFILSKMFSYMVISLKVCVNQPLGYVAWRRWYVNSISKIITSSKIQEHYLGNSPILGLHGSIEQVQRELWWLGNLKYDAGNWMKERSWEDLYKWNNVSCLIKNWQVLNVCLFGLYIKIKLTSIYSMSVCT